VIHKSLVTSAENASGFYFGDYANANRTKLFSTAKMAPWSRKNARQPATAETTDLAETPVHVEHSDVMLVSSQRILQICRCKAEASNRSSKTSERSKKTHLAQPERRHKQHPKCNVFRKVSEGSPATNGPDIQWKRNLSLLTRELRYKLRG
jgi:hypothetical protein